MPMVQYVDVHNDIRETRSMPTPKRIDQSKYWYNQARKALKEIPNLKDGTHSIEHEELDTEYLKFTLRSREGLKSHLVIMRKLGKDRVGSQ